MTTPASDAGQIGQRPWLGACERCGTARQEQNTCRVCDTVTLVIDRHPPVSLNAVLRMYRYERSQHNRLWKDEAAVAWVNAGRPEFERAVVTITLFYRGDRVVRDDDNLWGSVKPLLDGLKGLAFPRDDADCITVRVLRRVDNDRPRVTIELREWIQKPRTDAENGTIEAEE